MAGRPATASPLAGIEAPAPRSFADVAARLTWAVLPGPEIDRDTADLLARGIGGVVLFRRNVVSPEQVRRLTEDLRRRAAGPLRIAVDQEGGHVVRVGAPLTRFPSAMAIGATRSPGLAYEVALASGRELAALGIDVALAPVLDVAADPRNPTIGSRAFGSRPGLVALLGAAATRGYLDAGIAPTPKHFPGHGRTPLDSHVERPIVRGGLGALAALDLVPFQAAVAASTPVVMVSHVGYEGLGGALPATLSSAAMRTLLRDRLGFRGVILTDAMVMDAVADGRSVPDACVEALAAGADVVMPLEPQRRAIAEIERALWNGRLDDRSLAASLERVDRLDRRLAAARARAGSSDDGVSEARSRRHAVLAATVARRSLTLVHGAPPPALGERDSVLVVEFDGEVVSPIEHGAPAAGSLAALLEARLPRAVSVVVRPGPERRIDEARAIALARNVERIVVASRDSWLSREAQMLVTAIAGSGRPIVHAALRSPRDLAVFPAAAGIAAYSDVPASIEAVADALTRPAATPDRFPGSLPMRIDDVEAHSGLR